MNAGTATFWRRPRQCGFMSLMKMTAGPISCDAPIIRTVATTELCTAQCRLVQFVFYVNNKISADEYTCTHAWCSMSCLQYVQNLLAVLGQVAQLLFVFGNGLCLHLSVSVFQQGGCTMVKKYTRLHEIGSLSHSC